MRSLLFCIVLFVCLARVHARNMGAYNPETKCWQVVGDHLSCTFFQGCMYPVWFKDGEGSECPFFILADQFRAGKLLYKIQEERWAVFQVLDNAPDRFRIVCRGQFCHGLPPNNQPCKSVTAEYCYSFRRHERSVSVDIRLSKSEPVRYEVELCRLRWRFRPFAVYRTGQGDIRLDELLTRSGFWRRPSGELLGRGWKVRTSATEALLGWQAGGNGFFYLCDGGAVRTWAATKPVLTCHATWHFEPSQEARP